MNLPAAEKSLVSRAAEALRQGQLVAFPTETVYGLGADASNPEALSRLYAAKGRPQSHPVIVHLASVDALSDWATKVPKGARLLAERFWPGPLTLILPKAPHVLSQVTGGQDTVGLRVPRHPLALALLKEFGGGVAAPSANKFGHLSPTSADDVATEFADQVAMVLDGGPCDVGIESTIVDFSTGSARILRPGMILPEQIEGILGTSLKSSVTAQKQGAAAPRAPGNLPSHYAPRTTVLLSDNCVADAKRLQAQGKKVSVVSFEPKPNFEVTWHVASRDAHKYARELYSSLRRLDRVNGDFILVQNVPATHEWDGIRDRLNRASAKG